MDIPVVNTATVTSFRKIYKLAFSAVSVSWKERFRIVYKRFKSIAHSHPGAFGATVVDLKPVPKKPQNAIQHIMNLNTQFNEKYQAYLDFLQARRDFVKLGKVIINHCNIGDVSRSKLMTEKYPKLANDYPKTFGNVVSTFKFMPRLFTYEDGDNGYFKKRTYKMRQEVNNQFIDKLTKQLQDAYEKALTLKKYTDKERFLQLYDSEREFAKEHPIPFKYAVQNLEFNAIAFRKYAKSYLKMGTNRNTTAELGASYIMLLRDKEVKNLSQSERQKFREKLIKHLDNDMQEMDDYIKDFRTKYRKEHKEIVELRRTNLKNFFNDGLDKLI